MAFRDGRPVDGFMGAQPESAIRAFIDSSLGDDAAVDLAAALAAGDQAFEEGDVQGAAEIYASVLEENRDRAGCARRARPLLPEDRRRRARRADDRAGAAGQAERRGGRCRARRDRRWRTRRQGAGDTAELEAKVAANPADHQARIDLAVALAARGDRSRCRRPAARPASSRDRNWNEQAARKQLVQFFEAWGPKDAATIDGRRRLSSLLFS